MASLLRRGSSSLIASGFTKPDTYTSLILVARKIPPMDWLDPTTSFVQERFVGRARSTQQICLSTRKYEPEPVHGTERLFVYRQGLSRYPLCHKVSEKTLPDRERTLIREKRWTRGDLIVGRSDEILWNVQRKYVYLPCPRRFYGRCTCKLKMKKVF